MDTKKTCFSLLLFLFLLCNAPLNAIASDTISEGENLRGNQTITSKNGTYVMGFFTSAGDYQNNYLGIWYNEDRVSPRTVVWVANRDAPLSVDVYLVFEVGNLVIYGYLNKYLSSIWSTGLVGFHTEEAVLGDDGNLVIRDKSDTSVAYWQSFDHPTDTWLPGQKIVFSKEANQIQQLTSWKNRQDPATGIFNLELNPADGGLIVRGLQSTEVWRSGEWTGGSFTLDSDFRLNNIYNFRYNENENESYFTYNLTNSSVVSRFVLDVSGQIKQFTWSDTKKRWDLFWSRPKQLCDVTDICGPFGICNQDDQKCGCLRGFTKKVPSDWDLGDSTGGCQTNTALQCEGSKDIFEPILTSNLPDTPQSQQVNSTEECKLACQSLSTCSCIAYAYGDTTGCEIWEGDLMNIREKSDGEARNLYLRLANGTEGIIPTSKRKVVVWKIAAVPVTVSLMAIIIGVSVYMYLYKKNNSNERGSLIDLQGVLTDLLKNKPTYDDTPNTNMLNDNSEGETHELQIFGLVCLATATNNFCLSNKLGERGFGPVFKGKLPNGQHIAVKRLSKSSKQGIEEFKNEVVLISKLQHRNLVKLLGCCVEGQENMLIYEYMHNNSLDAFIFDPRNKAFLGWGKRFNIIGGIARGLLYLHRDSRLRVIHRDLKVSNILLDEDMIPKIADFGMARMFGGDQTSDNTSRVVGTMGYMSPEYMIGGTFSEKSDVFSFGVLVLEVVSGKRNSSFYDPDQPLNLLLHAWRLWNEGKWPEIVDGALGDMYSPSEVMKCIHIGLLCGQNRSVDRPTMAQVDFMLNYETDRPSPKEPPYTFPASSENNGVSPIHCSKNYVTLTTVEGR